jgi:hypothetical protein
MLFVVLLYVLPAILTWLGIDAVRSGVLRAKGSIPVSRSERPKAFWTGVAGYAAMAAFTLWVAIYGTFSGRH